MPVAKNNTFILKIAAAVTFVVMIAANIMATYGVFNNTPTAQVSNAYPNLFAPAAGTFAIWGVIYALLGIFTVYQFITMKKPELLDKVRTLFAVSSVANTLWIVSWSYYLIGLALVLMIVLLISLGSICNILKGEGFFLRLPFGIYFGWITVATIANVTTFLVSIGFDGFLFSESTWTIIVLVLGTIIASVTAIRNKDFPYMLAVIWGYIGILVKHVSVRYYAGQYPEIITVLTVCLIVLAVVGVIALVRQFKRK